MSNNEIELVSNTSISNALSKYENQLMTFISMFNLPVENVLVTVDERKKVIKNIKDALELLEVEYRSDAFYISKFIAAVSAGLFDAALNYLWDETIKQLRIRVAQYDIQYFYDISVQGDKRKRLKDIEDLNKLDDSELISGSKEIDLISDIGYRHLDHIKYMRNWASAAHPNQSELTGLQLIAWLETCIKEVISLPISNVTVEIGKLLKNIKENEITKEEADSIGGFFCNLSLDKVNSLGSGLFGIYTRSDTDEITRQNINLLLPMLWDRIDNVTKDGFGIKFARFTANGDKAEAKRCRSFLALVSGEQYLPENIRIAEINTALENLREAHNVGLGNFYKEPSFVRQLKRLVGTHGIPKQIDNNYVHVLVDAFLTNGNGVCWDAEGVYIELIKSFTERQVIIAIMSFLSDKISSKLQFNLCLKKYDELLDILEPKIAIPAVSEMLHSIKSYSGAKYKMKDDAKIQRQVELLRKLLK
jgi:hypothetical protein